MPLRKIDTTFDLPEAHIIVQMLRAEGVHAELFDADFVRQDWFKAIAYGGYRIMVGDSDVAAARERIQRYRADPATFADSQDPGCPKCGSTDYRDDPQPRRNVYLWLIFGPFPLCIPVILAGHNPVAFSVVVLASMALHVTLCLLLISYFKHRFVCSACGCRWRGKSVFPAAELDRRHAAAFGPPS